MNPIVSPSKKQVTKKEVKERKSNPFITILVLKQLQGDEIMRKMAELMDSE